jgi:uncharacterized SAM-binding protein YcdF (DUF218 family)
VFTLGLAVAVLAATLAGVAREPRSLSNAVLLGLALALGALALAGHLADAPGRPAHHLLLALLLAVALGPFALGSFLLVDGVVMVAREGLHAGNLVALLAGLATYVVIGLDVAADRTGDLPLSLFARVATLVFGYVSFLLLSYAAYAFGYGLLARAGRAEFVIVLGAGLGPGGEVPPLLASRLDRARTVWAALDRRAVTAGAFRPLLVVSGGQGDDEPAAEAQAMARYLTARGVPAGRLLEEGRSRSTEQNLRYSKEIIDGLRPGARVVIVTSDFHAFRAALTARRVGLRGQATGARVAGYYEPNAILREFAAVFLRYRTVNLGICAFLVIVPLGAAVLRHVT